MKLSEALADARQVRAYGFPEGNDARVVALVDGLDERTRMLDMFVRWHHSGRTPTRAMIATAERLVAEGK